MLKALALDNIWLPGFAKTKSVGAVKKNSGVSSFRLWLAIGLMALNAALLINYVYGVNAYASQGYKIKTLQSRLASLSADNRQISLKIAEANSMVSIQSDFLKANFVSVGTPNFLQVNQLSQR